MNIRPEPPPLQRQAVLVVSHADGHLEAFAERNIDVHLARVPAAHSHAAEVVAEDLAELLLPARYRELYRRDYLRANGSTRPLTADAMLGAFTTLDVLHTLNGLPMVAVRGAVA